MSFYEDFYLLTAAPAKRLTQRFIFPAIFGIHIPMTYLPIAKQDNFKNLLKVVEDQREVAKKMKTSYKFKSEEILRVIKEEKFGESDNVILWFGKMTICFEILSEVYDKRDLIHEVCQNYTSNLEKKRQIWKIFDFDENDYSFEINKSEFHLSKFKAYLTTLIESQPEVIAERPALTITPVPAQASQALAPINYLAPVDENYRLDDFDSLFTYNSSSQFQ